MAKSKAEASKLRSEEKTAKRHWNAGPSPVSQVVACQKWVKQLQANLALLADKCGGLEEANHAVDQSSWVPNWKELGEKHIKLMGTVRPLLITEETQTICENHQDVVRSTGVAAPEKNSSDNAFDRSRFLDEVLKSTSGGPRPSRMRGAAAEQPATPVHRVLVLPEKDEASSSNHVAGERQTAGAASQRASQADSGSHREKANAPQPVTLPSSARWSSLHTSESPPIGARPSSHSALREGAHASPDVPVNQPSPEPLRSYSLRSSALAAESDPAAEGSLLSLVFLGIILFIINIFIADSFG
jgi:hypothetical protein